MAYVYALCRKQRHKLPLLMQKRRRTENKNMSKYVRFNVSEERFTQLKALGFENIDSYVNSALDAVESKQKKQKKMINNDNK